MPSASRSKKKGSSPSSGGAKKQRQPLPGKLRRRRRVRMPGPILPGAAPGIESNPQIHEAPESGAVSIRYVDYGPARIEAGEVNDLEAFLAAPRPEWAAVRWVDVAGLHPQVINRFRSHFGFHTLSAEDALKVPQRPRVEPYPDYLFIVASMVRRTEARFTTRQVSFFFYGPTLLSFQEDQGGDVWSGVRQRLQAEGSNLRLGDGGFLLYSLLDAMVDHVFPVVEHFGDALEELEDRILEAPSTEHSRELHTMRRKMLELRRLLWPMRLMIHDLETEEFAGLSSHVKLYLRDVHEHAVQLIDVIETYRDMASGMIELYLSSISYRMNEIMKVLTIIATIFIPITFLAGVYGMNFRHMPELEWRAGYWIFWAICGVTVGGLLYYFRRKGWLGGDGGPG